MLDAHCWHSDDAARWRRFRTERMLCGHAHHRQCCASDARVVGHKLMFNQFAFFLFNVVSTYTYTRLFAQRQQRCW